VLVNTYSQLSMFLIYCTFFAHYGKANQLVLFFCKRVDLCLKNMDLSLNMMLVVIDLKNLNILIPC